MKEEDHRHRTLAVIGNTYQDGHLRLLQRLLRLLHDNGFRLTVQREFYLYLEERTVIFPEGTYATERLPADCEAAISIGGDGTFLHAAEWVGDSGIPVVGVNTGHLGYLSHFTLDDMDTLARSLRDGTLRRERRTLLRLKMPGGESRYALNEVAILKDETSSMIHIHTDLDGIFLADYSADGLIIATPTGSTGYNMSAGGPLLQPVMDAMVITPVAPHSLTQRPLVVSGGSRVTATTESRSSLYRVSVDGSSFTLPEGSTIEICRAPYCLNILTRPDGDFASTLRHKLTWATP